MIVVKQESCDDDPGSKLSIFVENPCFKEFLGSEQTFAINNFRHREWCGFHGSRKQVNKIRFSLKQSEYFQTLTYLKSDLSKWYEHLGK